MTWDGSDDAPQDAHRRWSVTLIAFAAFSALVLVGIAALFPQREAGDAPESEVVRRDDDGVVLLEDSIDVSDALKNESLTTPDFSGAVQGDSGAGPLALGVVTESPGEEYLDFLELCQPECYRDAHFVNARAPELGSGSWTAGRRFYVRHGFINNDPEPLGAGFEVVMYVTRQTQGEETPTLGGGLVPGLTYRLDPDFVMRGISDRCGPTYKTQTEPQTCEWFVHTFSAGLPAGRYDLWASWEAPCWAWIELGFIDGCGDPDEVLSPFSSGVNAPFDDGLPSFSEPNEAHIEE